MAYVTEEMLETTLVDYALTTALSVILNDYVTDTDLSTALGAYATTAAMNTALGSYTTTAGLTTLLGGYVTTSALNTALAAKVSTTALDALLEEYVLGTALVAALADYTTTSGLTTLLSSYVTSSSLTTTLGGYTTTAALNTALGSYTTTAALNTLLSSYVTSSALTSTLASYVTSSSLTTTLGGYVTTGSLSTTLNSYVTTSGLTTTLSSYASTASVALKAPLASPALTGVPTAPTAAPGTNTTQIATTAYVQTEISTVIAGAPLLLDTINEISLALGNDPNFATTITTLISGKATLSSPSFTGTPTAPTAAPGTNTTQLSTTAFVTDAISLKAPLASPTLTGTPAAPTATPGTNTTQLATTAFVTDAVAGKQPLDATLTALAGVTVAADKVIYATAADTFTTTDLTAAGRAMIGAANAAAQTALLDVFSTVNGLVPLSAGGTVNFLRADGTWAAPPSTPFTGGLLTSEIGIVAGTAAAPGLYFSGDTNTGIWSSAADTLDFTVGGVGKWRIKSSGHLIPVTNNNVNLGTDSGPFRISNIHAYAYWSKTNVSGYGWDGGTQIMNPSDGVIALYNNGSTSFGRLQFGGVTSSFPAIKRSGATLEARLADDSAYAPLKASILEAGTSVKFPDATTQTTAAVSTAVLLGSWNYSSDVAQVEITFAADTYAMIIVEGEGLSPSGSAYLQTSIRNAGGAILTLTHAAANAGAGSYAGLLAQFTVGRTGSKYSSGIMHYFENANTETSMGTASNATSADRVRIAWSAGNLDAGSIRVYGLKEA